MSESTREKAKHLILQCRGYNQLKKYKTAVEKGEKCIEIAAQLSQPDQDLITMEAALEMWCSYLHLHQDDDAIIYHKKYVEFARHYANSLPEGHQNNEVMKQKYTFEF